MRDLLLRGWKREFEKRAGGDTKEGQRWVRNRGSWLGEDSLWRR